MKADGKGATEKLKQTGNTPEGKPATTMMEWLGTVAPRFAQYLPKGMDPDRFMRIVIRAFVQKPKLAQCTKESVIIAVGEAAELGLVPNGVLGHGALIPYWNKDKKRYEAEFQPMYKGLLELMYRTRLFMVITADEVCKNDLFDYEKGLNARLYHKPIMGDRGEPWCYYAYYKTTNGGFDFAVMSREECLAWGEKYSPSWSDQSSAWHTALGEMCKKTVLWRLGKYSPVSVDLPSEIPEERPAEAARFADLMKDVLDVQPKEEVNGAGSAKAKAPETPPASGAAEKEVPEAFDEAQPGKAEEGAGAGTSATEKQPGIPGATATGATTTVLDPKHPITADQRAAAAAIDERRKREGGKKQPPFAELFSQKPPTAGKLNAETGEREPVPGQEDPDGPGGLV